MASSASTLPGPPVPEAQKDPGDPFQENLEAIVVAVILALMIRHYAMEAFVIPTGSMAPTLLGEHLNINDPDTGYSWPVNRTEGSFEAINELTGDARRVEQYMPDNSGKPVPAGSRKDVHGGNKILVNKFVYKFQQPERFDVIVFKFPDEPQRNFIKRLVGLPGERLKVMHGDLYANGQLVKKTASLNKHLMHPIYDQNYPLSDAVREPWDSDTPGRWHVRRRGQGADDAIKAVGVTPSLLAKNVFFATPAPRRTRLSFNREIRDSYGYNPTWNEGAVNSHDNGEHVVADIAFEADIIPPKAGEPVTLLIFENGLALQVDLPTKDGDCVLSRPKADTSEAVRQTAKMSPLKINATNHVEFSFVDRRARVAVNGQEVLVWDDPNAKPRPTSSSISIDAPPSGLAVQNVKLRRDIYYFVDYHDDRYPDDPEIDWDPKTNEVVIPEGSYFAMGDNCPNSRDSRKWGYVRQGHLVGRAFIVFWPPGQIRLIR